MISLDDFFFSCMIAMVERPGNMATHYPLVIPGRLG